ncbi:hypothetical protein [Geodermatophilus marinus]|uniref:hypothetical protein n=1 Tax=Geodermatophilus sp. LHW52908 TaxID=2303986 RepID=UPI000E3BB4E4|nr:hypothetical protein [Geodermatophilus sp. LHW52908]RFU18978.1 hypothetical protein D0Z06_23825 [Geodermatophilus sp. LHW52908]
MTAPPPPTSADGGRRLAALVAAGLVDSLCLSVAWTLLVLRVAEVHGLPAVGLCSAAMLVGVALSAPVAGRMARWLDGRLLLRTAAGAEMVLRAAVVGLVLGDAPVLLVALCVGAMNLTAWTGYAGMRAEVAAARPGASALTWYGSLVAAAEAAGVALAALLPLGPEARDLVLAVVTCSYVLSLVPTVVVAGRSPVPRAAAPARHWGRVDLSPPVLVGGGLMLLASGPTLLFVALTEELHGRTAVAAAAIAFTAGSLLAPVVAGALQRRAAAGSGTWAVVAAGMVAGWVVAPVSVVLLCGAQLLSGVCLTLLEGLLDNAAADRHPERVTGALASATAGRALGSAAATATLPLLLGGTSLGVVALVLAAVLVGVAVAIARRSRSGRAVVPRARRLKPAVG